MLGVSIYWLEAIYIHICILLRDTGQWKISETKRPVHVVNCFQLSDKPQSFEKVLKRNETKRKEKKLTSLRIEPRTPCKTSKDLTPRPRRCFLFK